VISELGVQRQKWHDKFQSDLEMLLPQSRKVLLEDLDVYAKHYLGVAFTRGSADPNAAAAMKAPRLNVPRYVQLLKDHEEVRVKAEQQVRHTKVRLESTRSLLESGSDESKLRTFHEVGAVDKITSMGMALLAMSVCPLPGAMEVWLVSSVVMLAETDHAGRHVVVEHPHMEPLAKIFKRFNTHPSLRAYDDFVLDWEPGFVDERPEDSGGSAANSSTLAAISSQNYAIPKREIRERCALVHNATSKSLVLSLLTSEQAEKAGGWMQKALRRHPVGRLLEKTEKKKDNAPDKFVVIAAGDIVKIPLEDDLEDSSDEEDESFGQAGGGAGGPSASISPQKPALLPGAGIVSGAPPAEQREQNPPPKAKFVKGFFHYGTTKENKSKAIGDAGLEPGQVISFVCVESPVQVVYRSIKEQRLSNSLQIKNECFEHCSVKVTQESSNFALETGLDPGSSVCFEGRNPTSRKVFQKTVNFDDTYQVLVKRGGAESGKAEVEAELSNGQSLRIEGMDI